MWLHMCVCVCRQERLTGGVLTGGRYKVWKELWLCVEGERIKLFKRREEGEAKKAVIHYDWPIDKVHVAEVPQHHTTYIYSTWMCL